MSFLGQAVMILDQICFHVLLDKRDSWLCAGSCLNRSHHGADNFQAYSDSRTPATQSNTRHSIVAAGVRVGDLR